MTKKYLTSRNYLDLLLYLIKILSLCLLQVHHFDKSKNWIKIRKKSKESQKLIGKSVKSEKEEDGKLLVQQKYFSYSSRLRIFEYLLGKLVKWRIYDRESNEKIWIE